MRNQLTSRPFHFMSAITLTVSTLATSMNPVNIPNGASGAIIANGVGAGGIHWTADPATPPTATFGVSLAAGETVMFRDELPNLKNLRFIRSGGSDGKLLIQFLTE